VNRIFRKCEKAPRESFDMAVFDKACMRALRKGAGDAP
jgi:hypothetical protein